MKTPDNTLLYFLFEANKKRNEVKDYAVKLIEKHHGHPTPYMDPYLVEMARVRKFYQGHIEKFYDDLEPFDSSDEALVSQESRDFLYVGEPVTKEILENQLEKLADSFLSSWEQGKSPSKPLRGFCSLVLKEYLKL